MNNFTSQKRIFMRMVALGLISCNAQEKNQSESGSTKASGDFIPDVEIEQLKCLQNGNEMIY